MAATEHYHIEFVISSLGLKQCVYDGDNGSMVIVTAPLNMYITF